MRTEVSITGDAGAIRIGYAPTRFQARLAENDGQTAPVDVLLQNRDPAAGGQVVFYPAAPGSPADTLRLRLPADGTPVEFVVGGGFLRASVADGDAAIQVTDAASGAELSATPLMVRIRKNAESLTPAERDRFLDALGRLNDRGMGPFSDFRAMHTQASDLEAHGGAGFLPWHRVYLLDLERELQAIDPSVALPYWRFDQPAPGLFTEAFIGVPDSTDTVRFTPGHPLEFWTTDGVMGIKRQPRFDTRTQPAGNQTGPVISEEATLALGRPGNVFQLFRRLQGQPHGRAHNSFGGSVSAIHTAAKDPLFFLLHNNVDRLWAKWQWFYRRYDDMSTDSYPFLGAAGTPGGDILGHNLLDTMWPWNGDVNHPRPSSAPGGGFPAVPGVAPGTAPRVGDALDYQGVLVPGRRMGFDYDDVPFQF
jgi:tyrosinase